MNRDFAILEKPVGNTQRIATPEEAGPSGISDSLVGLDPQWEITFEVLVRHVGKVRPQGVGIRPVTERTSRYATKTNLEQLIPLAIPVMARIHQMRAVREARGVQEVRITLPEQRTENVENPPQRMRTTRQRCREYGLQQRTFGDMDVDQIIEPVVKHDLRIEDHNHVDAAEHLEHFLVQQEVHRSYRLRVGAGKVKDRLIALTPQRTLDLVWPHAHAVVADIIFEVLLGRRHRVFYQLGHGPLIAIQQLFERRVINVVAETVAHFEDALFGSAYGCNDRVEVAVVPMRHTTVVQDDIQKIFLQFVILVNLGRRHTNALLEDLTRIRRQ